MKKIRIAAALLLLAVSLSLCTACSGSSYIMTANGKKQDIGPYLFYIQWMRDYYEGVITSSGYSWQTSLDGYYTDTQTLRDYLVSNAKSQYLSYFIVTQKFDELGLQLSEEAQAGIRSTYEDEWLTEYGEDGMKKILKALNLTKEEFMLLLSVQAKSQALVEYYYGPGGELEITEEDKREYFEKNYIRFKYILLSKTDDDGKNLPDEEIAHKKDVAAQLLEQLNNGESMEKLIPEYSEDYTPITDDMSETDRTAAERQNTQAVEDGLIIDQDGIFNQVLYSYYNIAVNATVVKKLSGMQNGEYATVEVDSAIWVIQKCDINEKESYYTDKADKVYQDMYGKDFSAKYTAWLAALDYTFNDAALEAYKPDNLEQLFFNLTEESVS